MDFFSYQAKRAKIDKDPDPAPTVGVPEIKLEELEARSPAMIVEETPASDTFIGRLDARIRKLWGKE